jgi:hypothetical protein
MTKPKPKLRGCHRQARVAPAMRRPQRVGKAIQHVLQARPICHHRRNRRIGSAWPRTPEQLQEIGSGRA